MIIICGATACGKTALAAALAKKTDGELVSADSMQIYRGMDIGTAKERDEDLGVKQHIIDVVNSNEEFSVVDYRERAVSAIRDIEARGKTPIVVGGTGFYITSLLTDLDYGVKSDPEVRARLNEELATLGADELHLRLAKSDPVSAQKIHKNNTKRLLRALEVIEVGGKPFSGSGKREEHPISPYKMYVLWANDREKLNDRINQRVDKMLERGLVDEVKGLLDGGVTFNMQSMQAIGYKEWRGYFESGEGFEKPISADEVGDLIKKNTRAYAKRQQTWFGNQYDNACKLDMTLPLDELVKTVEYYNN